MNLDTLPRFPVYSQLLHVASKYSCLNFGTFCIVGGRLLITERLSCKDTISGRSESSTCLLSKHIRKKGDKLCAQMKLIYEGVLISP